MNKIQTLKKEKIINQENNSLKYFKLEDKNTIPNKNFSYLDIDKLIKNAKKKILIASTGSILNDIIINSYTAISNNTGIYIILKSFDSNKEILAKYDKTKPAIIRENPKLENNFIIIDGEEFLFLNDLNSSDNTVIPISGNDLYYWFNYYFWNEAKQEKILEKLEKPKESPYPYFLEARKNVNIINDFKSKKNIKLENSIFPHDSKFRSHCEKYKNIFISRKIDTPFYFDDNFSILGNFIFNKNFSNFIMEKYKLQISNLKNINTNIIPFDKDNWKDEIEISEIQTIKLKDVFVEDIHDMEKEPEFTPYYYSINIRYEWRVIPPTKGKNTEKAKLYSDYDKLKKELDKYLEAIKKNLEEIKSKITDMNSFKGKKNKVEQDLKRVEEWKEKDLKKLSYNDLEDNFKSDGYFFEFYKEVFEYRKQFDKDLDEEKQKKKWEKEKQNSEKDLEKDQKEYNESRKKIEKIEDELKEQEDKKGKSKKIKKKIKKLEDERLKLRKFTTNYESRRKDHEDKYREFHKDKETGGMYNKKEEKKIEIKFSIPKYQLPDVGNLFEDNNNYYIEIENYEELEKADELAKNRYKDKKCKVVAKI